MQSLQTRAGPAAPKPPSLNVPKVLCFSVQFSEKTSLKAFNSRHALKAHYVRAEAEIPNKRYLVPTSQQQRSCFWRKNGTKAWELQSVPYFFLFFTTFQALDKLDGFPSEISQMERQEIASSTSAARTGSVEFSYKRGCWARRMVQGSSGCPEEDAGHKKLKTVIFASGTIIGENAGEIHELQQGKRCGFTVHSLLSLPLTVPNGERPKAIQNLAHLLISLPHVVAGQE